MSALELGTFVCAHRKHDDIGSEAGTLDHIHVNLIVNVTMSALELGTLVHVFTL